MTVSMALDFDVHVQLIIDGNKDEPKPFQVLRVSGADKRIPVGEIDSLQCHLLKNDVITEKEQEVCNRLDVKEAPEITCTKADGNTVTGRSLHPGMVRNDEFLGQYNDPEPLLAALGAKEPAEYSLLDLQTTVLYNYEPSVLIPVGSAAMGVASERIDKRVSTRITEKGLISSYPLVGVDADGTDLSTFPDPLRTKPLACSNPDGDTATVFAVSQGQLYVEEILKNMHPEVPKPNLKRKFNQREGVYEVPDWTDRANCMLLTNILFMSFVVRCTGKVQQLEGVAEYRPLWNKLQGLEIPEERISMLSLPTQSTVFDMIAFLLANRHHSGNNMGHYETRQMYASIDEIFKGGEISVDNWTELLETFAHDPKGHASVTDYLMSAGTAGKIDRLTLMKVFARALASTSKLQDESDSLLFILHHVIADVESMFPGFAGEVTLESVMTGFGSQFALLVLTRHMPAGTSFKDRLQEVHKNLMLALVELANGGTEGLTRLCSMGYVVSEIQENSFHLQWTGIQLYRYGTPLLQVVFMHMSRSPKWYRGRPSAYTHSSLLALTRR